MTEPQGTDKDVELNMPSDSAVTTKMLRDFRVYIMTWNVVCRGPIEDLRSALGLQPPVIEAALPDMYAIGFQEVSARPQHLLSQAFFEEPWIQAIRNALHKYDYVKVKHVRLQGLILSIFTKREHLIHLRSIQSTYTRTGLGGVWGNKGGVTIRLCAYGCSMCFVNSHLAAHESEIFQRINEYNMIIEKQRFVDDQATNILTHDYSFWFGDLNFRVDGCTMEEMRATIENSTYDQALEKDQLNRVRSKGEAFHEFMEHDITFPPTYKFQIDGMDYNFSHRKPAWTDRILYRFTKNAYENVALDLKQHQYVSHELYVQSDHKPVSGFFTLKVFAKPLQPIIHFLPVGTWIVNEDSFAWYYTTADTELKSLDWIGLYRENFNSLEDHLAYVWASTRPADVYPTHVHPRRSHSRSSRGSQSQHSPVSAGTESSGVVCGGGRVHRKSLRSPADLDNLVRSHSLNRPQKADDTPDDLASRSDDEQKRLLSVKGSAVMPPEMMTMAMATTKGTGIPSDQAAVMATATAKGTGISSDQSAVMATATTRATGISSDQADFEVSQWAPSEIPMALQQEPSPQRSQRATSLLPQDEVFYRVLFGDQTLLVSGRYRLIYLRGQSDVLGMSEPFKIKAAVN